MTEGGSSTPCRKGASVFIFLMLIASALVLVSIPEPAEGSPPLGRSYMKWRVEVLDREGDVGRNNSLAVDADGAVHISYYERGVGNLRYAVERSEPTGPLNLSAEE